MNGKNSHAGHRERIRKRFLDSGQDGLFEHELLELLLFYANSRKDTNPIAHNLLDTFGSLKAILEARPEQLLSVDGMTLSRASMISLVVPLTRVWHRCAMDVPDHIGNSREAENYCLTLLAGERVENFYVIALSAKCQVLGRRRISSGSLSEVSAYPRLFRRGLHPVECLATHASRQVQTR